MNLSGIKNVLGKIQAEARHGAVDGHQQLARIRYMERNLGLLVKAVIIPLLFYYLFFSNWFEDVTATRDAVVEAPPREFALESIRQFFVLYVFLSAAAAAALLFMERVSLKWLQQVVFTSAWFDALFVSVLTLVTGGFDSILYWVFLGLIIRNSVSVPDVVRQITLNLMVSGLYLLAGLTDVFISEWESTLMDDITRKALLAGPIDSATEPFVLRLVLLLLMTICCFGVQMLLEKQRKVEEESRESALRQEQLQATGRLAAEIAHQLKNPLGIINNAAFTLQRTVKEGKTITQQISIIREEVERSDRIITELMGYAQLSEGRVEKIDVNHELDAALERVFPHAAKYEVKLHRNYAAALPPLLVQRGHLSEALVNILQNAREAMHGKGNIWVSTNYGEKFSVIITIRDDGPGIPSEVLDKVFEPYFTTKEKGTGLGLAIVKHNTEIYNGTVQVDSELGKGTAFRIVWPAKTFINLKK